MTKEKTTPDQENKQGSSRFSHLIVYNDNVNTFDHVIDTLIKICDHNPEQAEQCTMIIHHKGKCVVKSGDVEILKEMCRKILERNIIAKVE